MTGLRAESSRENATPFGLTTRSWATVPAAVSAAVPTAEGGAARRGHALAVVWTEVCCTDVRRRATRRKCPRDIVLGQAQVDKALQAFPVNPVKKVVTSQPSPRDAGAWATADQASAAAAMLRPASWPCGREVRFSRQHA